MVQENFLRFFKFVEIKEEGPNFCWEAVLEKFLIICPPPQPPPPPSVFQFQKFYGPKVFVIH